MPTLFVRAYKEQQQGDYNIIICGFGSPLKTKHLKSGRLKNRCTLTAECNIDENVAEEPAQIPACVVPLKKKKSSLAHIKVQKQLEECSRKCDEGEPAACVTCSLGSPRVNWSLHPKNTHIRACYTVDF